MLATLKGLTRDHMLFAKFVVSSLCLWTSGALIGTVAVSRKSIERAPQILLSPRPQVSDGVVIAVHSERLDELSRQNQASIDDRKVLHDQLGQIDRRLDIDEAQFKTLGWFFGTLLSASSMISAVLTVLRYRSDRQKEREQPPIWR